MGEKQKMETGSLKIDREVLSDLKVYCAKEKVLMHVYASEIIKKELKKKK